MTRTPDPAWLAERLRSIAADVERNGAEMLSSPEPLVHAWLSVYREACPVVATGLRAHAAALGADRSLLGTE